MSDIKAVKKSSLAEESTQKYFQTINLILTRFKRLGNRQEIFKLTGNKNNLSNLLVGACTIQCFHYLGVRTETQEVMISRETNQNIQENQEKEELYQEILVLFKDSLEKELDLLLGFLKHEMKIIESLYSQVGVQEYFLDPELTKELEDFIYESYQLYPDVFWLDYIGEWLGYKTIAKSTILKSSAGIKSTSIDLERELVNESVNDKYIELSTIKLIFNKVLNDYNLKSLRNFHFDKKPIENITQNIHNYQLSRLPKAKEALKQHLAANNFKIAFFEKLQKANKEDINFIDFQNTLKEWIIQQIREKAVSNITHFNIFLQNILDLSKSELLGVMSDLGIDNVNQYGAIQSVNTNQFLNDAALNQLTNIDFLKFEENTKNLEKVQNFVNQIYTSNNLKDTKPISKILKIGDETELEILHQACDLAKLDINIIKQIYMKNLIISSIIQPKYPIGGNLSNYALLFNIDKINDTLANQIFFNLFAKVCVQIARIYENFVKIKQDKGIILLGLKRIFDSKQEEDWIRVKIEELIIQRLMARQKEVSFIFDVLNDSFFVNSFIYARLFDTTLSKAQKIFENEPAYFYKEVADIPLKKENLSPVSYIFAYEILERFKQFRITIRNQREEKKVERDKREQDKKNKISQEQQLNTLNWIEKRITGALISISAISVNPTSVYWSEKDSKMAVESLITHTNLGSRKICVECGTDATTNPCLTHPTASIDATPLDLATQFYHFALTRIQEQWKKLTIPSFQDLFLEIRDLMTSETQNRLNAPMTRERSHEILDGEMREVASQVVERIGKQLDKVIYKKFKANLKKNRQK